MFTGLSTAAGPVVHIGAKSGACLIAAFVGTSTGQGTRRRGNPGETPGVKRTGPALRPGVSGDPRIVTCGRRDPGSSSRRSQDRRRTGEPDRDHGTTRSQYRGTPKTRSATGYSRPPSQVRPRRRRRQGPDPNGQVQPGLGEGTKHTGPPARFVPSLNWALAQSGHRSIDPSLNPAAARSLSHNRARQTPPALHP